MPDATPSDNPTADLESQAAGTPDGKTVADPSSEGALDAALKAEGFNPDGSEFTPTAGDLEPKDKKQTPPAKKDEAAPTLEEKATDGTPAAKEGEQTPAAPKDDFDAVELPPHTKPKTAESFFKLKEVARAKVSTLEKERDDLKNKLSTAEAKAKEGLSPEQKKEVEELRAFRQKMDVEADPAFKDYDAKVKNNIDSIYSRLEANGFDKAAIERVKELGGPAGVNWDGLTGKISSTLKRYIEGKLFENEDLAEKKKSAIETAKKNANEYLQGRESAMAKRDDDLVTEANKTWSEEILPKMAWLKVADVEKEKDKDQAVAHNKLVEQINGDIKEALADNSPRMKALLIAGYANSQKMRWEFDRLKSGTDAKIAALEKELSEAKGMVERIKKSSPGRVNSNAPANGGTNNKKASINADPGENLDRMLEEQLKIEAAKEQ